MDIWIFGYLKDNIDLNYICYVLLIISHVIIESETLLDFARS